MWRMLCDCGEERDVSPAYVKVGRAQHCGSSAHCIEGLAGRRFGMLTAISLAGVNKHRQARWLCRCDCGVEKVIAAHSFKSGMTVSCGCALESKPRLRPQRTRNTAMAADHKRRARKVKAIPPWFGELDALVWLEASDLVQRREAATGFPWHADHMIPLAARKACGLHVAENCQVIPAALNTWKQNRMILTKPLEWLIHV